MAHLLIHSFSVFCGETVLFGMDCYRVSDNPWFFSNSADPGWQYVRVSYGNNYYFHEANMDIVRVGWSLLKGQGGWGLVFDADTDIYDGSDLWHQFMAHI